MSTRLRTDLQSALPRLWITADHHFGHANIVDYAGRPFTVDEQDTAMARRWRETVPADEPLLHLGDLVVGTKSEAIWELVASLPGHPKWLVLGNHDRPHRHAQIEAASFSIIVPPIVQYRGWTVRLTHRPVGSEELGPQELNVHGHTHSRSISTDPRWINVSAEATDYRPVRVRELLDPQLDRPESASRSLAGS